MSSSIAMSVSPQSSILPPFFPIVRNGCDHTASEFFQCLSEKSEPKGGSISANMAVESCSESRYAYEKCTRASLASKGARKPISLVDWETD